MNLDELEKLLAEATQGHWYVSSNGCIHAGQDPDENGYCVDPLVADMSCDHQKDRRLIAAFFNAAPKLIAVARAAKVGPCRHAHDQHVCDMCKALAALEGLSRFGCHAGVSQ